MSAYFGFLSAYLLVFALVYTLAYLPGVFRTKLWIKRNTVFLIPFALMLLFGLSIPVSYLGSLSFICLVYNIYLPLPKRRKQLQIVIDFVIYFVTLFLSACILAEVDDLPIKHIIHERFDNGGYSFSPGYLHEMIITSISFSLLIVNFKYIHLYILNRWEERQNRKVRHLQSQKQNVEMQFEALQAKVNPHFLYNSLNSIAGLATIDGNKTRQMALALSRFFRYSMNREQEILITIEEEAEMIETYLEIEKIRFGDMLSYHIDLPSDLEPRKIPRMLLQPIVENCIKHGMKGDVESLMVEILFSISGQTLIISVKDNGAPFPDDFIPGYGITSVYEKLDLLFSDNYKVELNTFPEKDFRIFLNQGRD